MTVADDGDLAMTGNDLLMDRDSFLSSIRIFHFATAEAFAVEDPAHRLLPPAIRHGLRVVLTDDGPAPALDRDLLSRRFGSKTGFRPIVRNEHLGFCGGDRNC